MHLLGGPVDVDALAASGWERPAARPSPSGVDLGALVAAVEELRARVDRLEHELGLAALGPDQGGGDSPDYS
jgi:uncharacterized protein YceH (UPF0502 family)